MNSKINEAILTALSGITETEGESDLGWWPSSDGADFGRETLGNLIKSIAVDKICSLECDDYVLELNHPSGKIIKILIPVDGGSIFEGEPYGLNMVCNGHYT